MFVAFPCLSTADLALTRDRNCSSNMPSTEKPMRHVIGFAPIAGRVVLAAALCVVIGNADAQQFGSVREGRRLAHAECAQCHGVGKNGFSTNPKAPAFEDIAHIPGMTSAALTVALQTSHRSMPNFVIKGHDAQNIIAYILNLKKEH